MALSVWVGVIREDCRLVIEFKFLCDKSVMAWRLVAPLHEVMYRSGDPSVEGGA